MEIDSVLSEGLLGKIEKIEGYVFYGELRYFLERYMFLDVDFDWMLRYVVLLIDICVWLWLIVFFLVFIMNFFLVFIFIN